MGRPAARLVHRRGGDRGRQAAPRPRSSRRAAIATTQRSLWRSGWARLDQPAGLRAAWTGCLPRTGTCAAAGPCCRSPNELDQALSYEERRARRRGAGDGPANRRPAADHGRVPDHGTSRSGSRGPRRSGSSWSPRRWTWPGRTGASGASWSRPSCTAVLGELGRRPRRRGRRRRCAATERLRIGFGGARRGSWRRWRAGSNGADGNSAPARGREPPLPLQRRRVHAQLPARTRLLHVRSRWSRSCCSSRARRTRSPQASSSTCGVLQRARRAREYYAEHGVRRQRDLTARLVPLGRATSESATGRRYLRAPGPGTRMLLAGSDLAVGPVPCGGGAGARCAARGCCL